MAAPMHPWTKAFVKWVDSVGGRLAAAVKLQRSPATIHSWFHGLLPRDKNLAHVESVSAGAVKASLVKARDRASVAA